MWNKARLYLGQDIGQNWDQMFGSLVRPSGPRLDKAGPILGQDIEKTLAIVASCVQMSTSTLEMASPSFP